MIRDIHLDIISEVSLSMGLLALGIATGTQVSLSAVQNTIMTTHLLPLKAQAGNLYPVLLMMQDIVNWSGYAAAALLVGGAVLARREMVHEQFFGGETDA